MTNRIAELKEYGLIDWNPTADIGV